MTWLIPLIYDNKRHIQAQTQHMWHWRHACIFTCHLSCLDHSCISSNHIFHCTPLRSRTLSQKGATPLHPSSSAPQHSPPIVSCSLRPIWDPTMDRSAKELFLNFMIVLITVLLMWLLVKTYQDWTMEQQQKRDEREAEETERYAWREGSMVATGLCCWLIRVQTQRLHLFILLLCGYWSDPEL